MDKIVALEKERHELSQKIYRAMLQYDTVIMLGIVLSHVPLEDVRNIASFLDRPDNYQPLNQLRIESPNALVNMKARDLLRLEKMIDQAMQNGESGRSASGATAAMAIRWCEEHNYIWHLLGMPGVGYHVTRGEKI